MAIGGAIAAGDSRLFTGPLGVVRIGFDGYDLGKTVGDCNLTPDQDIKDIMYQQDGSKPADHVRTGVEYLVNATLGKISTTLVGILMAGITAGPDAGGDDAGHIDRSIFQSMLDNEAKVLKVAACDTNGLASALPEDIFCFYHAIPIITGELVNWGVDTQRNLPIQFRIKYYTFTTTELTALTRNSGGAFGYWGDPADPLVDCTAVTWPDKAGPEIVSAVCDLATQMTVTFDENIDFIDDGAFEATHWIAQVNGAYKAPTGGAITDAAIALTFVAGTFTAGGADIVYLSIVASAVEDEATPPENPNQQVDNYPCTPLA